MEEKLRVTLGLLFVVEPEKGESIDEFLNRVMRELPRLISELEAEASSTVENGVEA